MTEETKRKIGFAHIGKKHSPETLLKLRLAKLGKPSNHKGCKASQETRERLRISHLGIKQSIESIEKRIAKIRGRKQTKEEIDRRIKSRISRQEEHRKRAAEKFAGKTNDVCYQQLHKWVRLVLGQPDTCEICKKSGLKGKQIHWANKNHQYKRNKEDWIRLCPSCHWKHDRTYLSRRNH